MISHDFFDAPFFMEVMVPVGKTRPLKAAFCFAEALQLAFQSVPLIPPRGPDSRFEIPSCSMDSQNAQSFEKTSSSTSLLSSEGRTPQFPPPPPQVLSDFASPKISSFLLSCFCRPFETSVLTLLLRLGHGPELGCSQPGPLVVTR